MKKSPYHLHCGPSDGIVEYKRSFVFQMTKAIEAGEPQGDGKASCDRINEDCLPVGHFPVQEANDLRMGRLGNST